MLCYADYKNFIENEEEAPRGGSGRGLLRVLLGINRKGGRGSQRGITNQSKGGKRRLPERILEGFVILGFIFFLSCV